MYNLDVLFVINVKGVLYVCIVLWYLLGILQNTQRPLEFIRVSVEKEIKEQMTKHLSEENKNAVINTSVY